MPDKKKLPIGEEFFRNIRTKGFCYVDKTGFICELLKTRGSVNFFTCPRHFEKSLNVDMLKTFNSSIQNPLCISQALAAQGKNIPF